jgi:hypothetical protein
VARILSIDEGRTCVRVGGGETRERLRAGSREALDRSTGRVHAVGGA